MQTDHAMEHEGLVRRHGVLVIAERGETLVDEARERLLRLKSGDGKPERLQITEMIVKTLGHQAQDLPGDIVRTRATRRRDIEVRRGWLAVLGIIVPAPARRLVALHQQARAPPHLPVEVFHPQCRAAVGPSLEIGMAADEAIVFENLERRVETVGKRLEGLAQAPFSRFCNDQRIVIVAVERANALVGQRAGILRVVQLHIIDGPARIGEFVGEVAHGREDQGDLLLVVADISRLVADLRHQHNIAGRIGRGECCYIGRELIPENEDQPPPGAAGAAQAPQTSS